ncbi:MAG TPA: T9SS type A sorting domain-containing protein, partial [Bacteroidales bacterium]|nr:T9SS type A sorting domain-containing protein [Bacteroidales bacterium]
VTYTVPIISDATSYTWTLPSGCTGNSSSNSITVDFGFSATSGTITVLGSNSCGEGYSSSLDITVNPLPAAAGLISGSTTVCQGQNTVTYSVPPISDAISYTWTMPAGVTGSSSSNSIILDFGLTAVSGNITVKGTNACGEGLASTFPVTVSPLPTAAGIISGNMEACLNQSGVLYSVPVIDYATSYNWTLPSGATGTSSTSTISVYFGSSASSGTLSVVGVNGCGTGTPSSITVSVSAIPEAAGIIAGSANVCQGQNSVTYTVPSIPGTTTYLWTLPSGATGSSSSNSISVDYGVSASSGTITVLGSNYCGEGSSSSLNITVNPLPAAAGTISGVATVCQGQNEVIYSVASIPDATSYNWTLPSGASGSSTTNSITVDFGLTAVSGDLTVQGVNGCGAGTLSILPVVVYEKPEKPTVSINMNVLHSSSQTGNQWYDQTGIILNATDQDYVVTVNGNYFVIVTIDGCASDPSDTIQIINVNTQLFDKTGGVNVYPNPVSDFVVFEIKGNKETVKISIMDFMGRCVYSGQMTGYKVIETAAFSSGVYLVKFESAHLNRFYKLVKQ